MSVRSATNLGRFLGFAGKFQTPSLFKVWFCGLCVLLCQGGIAFAADEPPFSETAGFNADPARPLAYKFRDYVIRAFNRGIPFDRFLLEQLAGDELFPDDPEALAATGYCRMWADESNASNIHLARQLALNDLTGNLGAAVLGLSVGCAQCHNHKFDPLLQTDFYQLQAFFSGIVLEDKLPIGSHEQLAVYRRQRQEWLEQTNDIRHELHAIEREARIKMAGDRRMKFPQDVLAAIDCLPEERTAMQRQLAFWSERQMEYKNDDLPKNLTDAAKARREELLTLLEEARKTHPKPPREASVMAVMELSTLAPKTHLLDSGSYDKPLGEVVPHYPVILRRESTQNPPSFVPPNDRSSGRRSCQEPVGIGGSRRETRSSLEHHIRPTADPARNGGRAKVPCRAAAGDCQFRSEPHRRGCEHSQRGGCRRGVCRLVPRAAQCQ